MADKNLIHTTRGRSFTNFPRNTKHRHLLTCARQAREAEVRAAQIEAAYAEYLPDQVFHSEAMFDADSIAAMFDGRRGVILGTAA